MPVHWGRINAANKDIEASTNYPTLGTYDSHDPKVLDQHCRWARGAGIDTFIVSWWSHNSYCDRATEILADTGICGVAVGGITPDNVEEVLSAGATAIAVCSAVTEASDPTEACRELKQKIAAFKK